MLRNTKGWAESSRVRSLPPPHQQVLLDVVDEDVELPHGFVDPVLIHLQVKGSP